MRILSLFVEHLVLQPQINPHPKSFPQDEGRTSALRSPSLRLCGGRGQGMGGSQTPGAAVVLGIVFRHAVSGIRRQPSIVGRRVLLVAASALALCSLGASGSVLSLTASGGGGFGDTITISTSVRADNKVNNSNLYFEIRAPDGTVVDTHGFGDVPSLEEGDTYGYSWNSNNGGYPAQGNYTVSVCWSTGNSHNCNIAQASTGFYSVPSLGTVLTLVALGLLALWIWSARHTLFGRGSRNTHELA
jgi:hypothetical protein